MVWRRWAQAAPWFCWWSLGDKLESLAPSAFELSPLSFSRLGAVLSCQFPGIRCMFRLDELMNENILLQGFGSGALHGGPPFLSPPSRSTAHPGPPEEQGPRPLQQHPGCPVLVWIGPLCCGETKRLAALGQVSTFQTLFS